MAISDKDAALELIEQLPEGVSRSDIVDAITAWQHGHQGRPSLLPVTGPLLSLAAPSDHDEVSVPRRLVKKGWITVLEPAESVPQLTVEMVNDLIEEMHREREDRFLGRSD